MISNIPYKFKEIVKLIFDGYTLPGETFYEILSSFGNVYGIHGETVNEILYKILQTAGVSVTPNDTTYNYLCQLVYLLSEHHILNDKITSKYIILDELYEALAFNRNPAPNRLVYYNDTMLNDSKYAVGSTFCGATITAHIYNNNIKVGAIEFDQTVTDLESSAFRNTHINNIYLPTEVVTIGDNAFFQCYYLEGYSWRLPDTVTTIGDYTFASTDIRELRVPAGATSIGHGAFTGVKNIVYTGSASYGQNDPYWGAYMVNGVWESRTGNLYSADGTIFACVGYPDDTTTLTVASGTTTIGRDAARGCTQLTSVTLPSSLTTIQSGAFIQCNSLPAITIPSGVTSIGAFAFSGDTSLIITMTPTVPPTLAGSNEFTGVQRIFVPESSYNDYVTAWSQWSSIIKVQQIPLNFTAEDNNSTVRLIMNGTLDTSYEYSTDNITWSPYTIGDTVTLTNAGDKVYFRGDNSSASFNWDCYMQFKMSGSIAASGNIMSILDKTMNSISVPELGTYRLFSDCTSLTTAPELPATTLSEDCYSYMFQGCTSLTSAPELPATTLADSCYWGMFNGCTSLTTAPELPATELADYCYYDMFDGCSSLTELTVYADDVSAPYCLSDWLTDTASGTTGRLHSLGSADFTGNVPSNWNIFYGDLTVTSDTTISSRIGYENINVSNNAVLTISDTFVQALDTITVEAGSQIRVSPTSVLVAGEGGIITADVNGLYIEADANGNGAVVFNETVSNNHPLATVAVYNYSYSKPDQTRVWEHIASPISTTVKTNDGIIRQGLASLNKWLTNGGWVTSSFASEGLSPNAGYNTTRASTTKELDWQFYGTLRGNEPITYSASSEGYYAISLNYTASVPISYMLTLLANNSSLTNQIDVLPRQQNDTLTAFLHITTSNIDLYPEILMMQAFFIMKNGNSATTLTVNYNDAVLAYYKQKYNF